jgi:hypothetical protein
MLATYRIYFIDDRQNTVGHHDFNSPGDAAAMAVAATLADACSDLCRDFELWYELRRVDTSRAAVATQLSLTEQLQALMTAHEQASMIAHEETIRDSRQAIAKSKRLLQRLALLKG